MRRECVKFLLAFVLALQLSAASKESRFSSEANWPMWRHDPQRTASTPHELPEELNLQWIREYPALEPTWEDIVNQDRMGFGMVYEPVVWGRTVFIGSNRTDSVVALDTRTGAEKWKVYTDGPVRLPPAAYEGRVYFVSDDGCLYCVDAGDGSEIWRFRGGLSRKKVLGNSRLISMWPARGGPVAKDGKVYFAASIWPFMGTFIYALDAETGEVIWRNERLGSAFASLPHGGANGFGSLAPQGALAVLGDRLLVPGGRSVPACLDLRTGKLLYYHLSGSRYHKLGRNVDRKREGGSHVCGIGSYYFNRRGLNTTMYDVKTGNGYIMWRRTTYPVLTRGTLYLSGDPVCAYELTGLKLASANKKSWHLPKLFEFSTRAKKSLILAGSRLYAGGEGIVAAFELSGRNKPEKVWEASVSGAVRRLVAADNRLFAVTKEGRIYAFGEEESKIKRYEAAEVTGGKREGKEPEKVLFDRDRTKGNARDILECSGVNEGYCLVFGEAIGDLVRGLVNHSQLYVIGVSPDRNEVRSLREGLDGAGLYGKRASVHPGTVTDFGAPPYLASLAVLKPERGIPCESEVRGLFRSLRPYGGTAYFPAGSEKEAESLFSAVEALNLPGSETGHREGYVFLKRAGPLPGSDSWTHQRSDAANTFKSDDKLVKLPLGLLWFGGNSHSDVLPRHSHGPIEQVVGGRLFIEGINMLSARDVYTGRVLWKRKFSDLGTFGIYYDESYDPDPLDTSYNQEHIPGANSRGSNYVSTEDGIYLAKGNSCLVLDPATGETLRKFQLPSEGADGEEPRWGYIAVYEDLLLAGSGQAGYSGRYGMKMSPAMNFDAAVSDTVVVMDRYEGSVLWEKPSEYGFRHNAIAAGKPKVADTEGKPGNGRGMLFCIDAIPEPVLDFASRRGKSPESEPALFALDIRTGETVWRKKGDVFGTWLGYSGEYDVLIQCGRASRDMIKGEPDNRMAAFRGRDGSVLWDKKIHHSGPCMLHHRTIYLNAASTRGSAVDLLTGELKTRKNPLTGERMPWQYYRFYGCNSVNAGEYILAFRSGAAGFYDLEGDSGTGNFGGFKSGCTSNLIAADGVLNAPDYTRTCTCAYQNQTSLALVHMPEAELWTFNRYGPGPGWHSRIRRIGVNFGAPGDRRAENSTMWFEFPRLGGPSPAVPVKLHGKNYNLFRRHERALKGGSLPWVGCSGVEGMEGVSLYMYGPDRHAATEYLVASGAKWDYLLGSHPEESWKELGFEGDKWETGRAGFGYGDGDDTTELAGMKGGPAVLYIRKTFSVDDIEKVEDLCLEVRYDDGFIAYLNGTEVARAGVDGEGGRNISAVVSHEAEDLERFPIEDHKKLLVEGKNVLALEGHNVESESSDFSLNPALRCEVPCEVANYTVRLFFAEKEDVSSSRRVFDVSLQGEKVLEGLNVAEAAGGPLRCLVKEFEDVQVENGLHIGFQPSEGSELPPFLCGLEAVIEAPASDER